jgi:hypothetical protein
MSWDDVKVISTEVTGFVGTAWLIEIRGQYFVISAVNGETRAFDANATGYVESWSERTGVDCADHEACIDSLLRILDRTPRGER